MLDDAAHRGIDVSSKFQEKDGAIRPQAFLPDTREGKDVNGYHLASMYVEDGGAGLRALRALKGELCKYGWATVPKGRIRDVATLANLPPSAFDFEKSPPDHHADLRFAVNMTPLDRTLLSSAISIGLKLVPNPERA